jgi:antitoxin component YwqK of YwqJK toxin-antitoxin module
MKRILIIAVMLGAVFFSCHDAGTSKNNKNRDDNTSIVREFFSNGKVKAEISVKDNKRHGITKNYSNKGRLLSVVNYANGRKEGKATNYYSSGKVHSTMVFKNGLKEGEAVWYYENGNPYSVNQFVGNKLNGIQKKYYRSGNLQSEIPYKDGQAGTGLKEYTEEGKLIGGYPVIIVREINRIETEDKFILNIYLSPRMSNVHFYLDDLDSGKYLKKYMYEIPSEKGVATRTYDMPQGYVKFQKINIIARVKTRLGNIYITQKTYNLAIQH